MTDDMIARVALAAFVLAVALRGWLVARARPQARVAAPYDDGTQLVVSPVDARRTHRRSPGRPCHCRSAMCQPRSGRWLVRAAGVA